MIRMMKRRKTRAAKTTPPTAPTMMYNRLSDSGGEVEGDDEAEGEGTGEGSATEPRKNMPTM